jgi:hypothetical protein
MTLNIPSTHFDLPPPYTGRPLTHAELLKEDVYDFESPKHGLRRVHVAGVPNLILALLLEFDPNVECYVERPRLLTCDKDIYEFSFWYRDQTGREYLPLLVPTSSTAPLTSGRRRHRKSEQLIAAAEQAHLPLKFEYEAEIIGRSVEFTSSFRMLPSVQLATQLHQRFALREQIMNVASRVERIRASQIVSSLNNLPRNDLCCVVCDLIHAGLLVVDKQRDFTFHSVCQVRRP